MGEAALGVTDVTLTARGLASEEQESLQRQTTVLQVLQSLPVHEAIGAACSFLLHCAYNHRVEFRRVMNERVIREGFSGLSLLDVFKRVSR
jgi:hypothetical protein